MEMSIMGTDFWVVTSCNLDTAQCFGGTYRLHLLELKRRPSKKPEEAGSKLSLVLLVSCLAYSMTLKMKKVVNVGLSSNYKALQHRKLYYLIYFYYC
jgi:hypothetical protein